MKQWFLFGLTVSVAGLLVSGCTSSAPVPPPVYHNTSAPETYMPPRPPRAPTPPPPHAQPAPPPAAQSHAPAPAPSAHQPLLAEADMNHIIEQFKAAYTNLGSPRILIHVSRDLGNGATNLAARASADKETARELERDMGRPFRAAGATLIDEAAAAPVLANKPLDAFLGKSDTPQAQQDRAALAKIADVVVEVLLSYRPVSVPALTGNQTISIPYLQATAIRLSDSKVLGQAASGDGLAKVPVTQWSSYPLSELAEATAVVLMDEMLPETK